MIGGKIIKSWDLWREELINSNINNMVTSHPGRTFSVFKEGRLLNDFLEIRFD